MAKRKRQLDTQELARSILDQAVPDAEPPKEAAKAEAPGTGKNPPAVALGRLGGLKGGKARAVKLSAAKRKAIAKKAVASRWKKAN
jgi:hypothetical protein